MIKKIVFKTLIITFWLTIIFSGLYLEDILSLSKEKKSLNIFAWAGMFDSSYIAKFEKETGIRVNISYYETNEELLVKLKATKGHGYDLIVPSDYTVNFLREQNMLKELNKSKLVFWNKLNPILLNHGFDPNNNYSIPFEWSVLGLGYNKNILPNPKKTWGLIFDPKLIKSPIAMLNDPMWSIALVSYYLFNKSENITVEKLQKIKDVLKNQRKFVLAYSDFRADYLLASKDVVIGAISSSYILRSMKKYKHIGFIIPKEGSQATIENFAIPKTSNNENLAYKFLNFIYQPESILHNFNSLSFFPPTIDVIDKIKAPKDILNIIKLNRQEFKKFDFLKLNDYKAPITEQMLLDLWVQVKTSN